MFDPYRKWLGIAPREQPPNHYRLLGVNLFEDDLDVIEGAADKQMAFVRQYQSGDHAHDAARILNELALARLCLLKSSAKAAYDENLRKDLATKEAEPEGALLDLPLPDANPKSRHRKPPRRLTGGVPGKSKSATSSLLLKIGIGAAVSLLLLAVFLFSGRSDRSDEKTPLAGKPDPAAATPEQGTAQKTDNIPPSPPAVVVVEQVGLVRTWQGELGQSQFGVFSSDGRRLVYSKDNDIFIIDAATGENPVKLTGHEKPVWVARFSGDDNRIVSIGQDNTIRFWDAKAGTQISQCGALMLGICSVLVMSNDASRIAFSWANDRTLVLMDPVTQTEVRRINLTEFEVVWRSVTPDLKWAMSNGIRNETRIWDLNTGDSYTVDNGHHNYCGQFAQDGMHAMLGGAFTWDRWDFQAKAKLKEGSVTGGHVYAIATSPDTSRFLMGLSDGTVWLWDMETAKGVMGFTGHEKPVSVVVMSPDNKLAISCDSSGVIILWRLPK